MRHLLLHNSKKFPLFFGTRFAYEAVLDADDAPQESQPVEPTAPREDLSTLASTLNLQPDELKDAKLYFGEGDYENTEKKEIFDKIKKAKEENKLPHFDTSIVSGTDATGYSLDKIKKQPKAWHEAKKEAFEILLQSKHIEPDTTKKLLDDQNNRILIEQYIAEVKKGKSQADKFLADHEENFLASGSILDLATGLQRAMELRKQIETKPFDPEKDTLTIKLENIAIGQEYRYATLKGLLTLTLGDKNNIPAGPPPQNDKPPESPNNDDNNGNNGLTDNDKPKFTNLDFPYQINDKLKTLEREEVEKILATNKLKTAIESLPQNLRERLHLCPPIIGFTDSGIEEWDSGFFFKLDIRKSPEEIAAKMKKITTEITDDKYTKNTKFEEQEHSQEVNMHFLNIRLAYRTYQKGELDWSAKKPTPANTHEWIKNDYSKNDYRLNFALQEKYKPEYGKPTPAEPLPKEKREQEEKTRQDYITELEKYIAAFDEYEKEKDGKGFSKSSWQTDLTDAQNNSNPKFSDKTYTKEWSGFMKSQIAKWKKEKIAAIEAEHQELEKLTKENAEKLGELEKKYGISIYSHYYYDRAEYTEKKDRDAHRNSLTKISKGIPAFSQALEMVFSHGMMGRLRAFNICIWDSESPVKKIETGRYVFNVDSTKNANEMFAYIDHQIDAFVMDEKKEFQEDDPDYEKPEREKCKKSNIPFTNSREAYGIKHWIEKSGNNWQPKGQFIWYPGASSENFTVIDKPNQQQKTPPKAPPPSPPSPPNNPPVAPATPPASPPDQPQETPSKAPPLLETKGSKTTIENYVNDTKVKEYVKYVGFFDEDLKNENYDWEVLKGRRDTIKDAILYVGAKIKNDQAKKEALKSMPIVILPTSRWASALTKEGYQSGAKLIAIDSSESQSEIVKEILDGLNDYLKEKAISDARSQRPAPGSAPQSGSQNTLDAGSANSSEVQSTPERQVIENKLKNWNNEHQVKVKEIILAPDENYNYDRLKRQLANNGIIEKVLTGATENGVPLDRINQASFVISPSVIWHEDTYTYTNNRKTYIVLNPNIDEKTRIDGIKKALNIH